MHLISAPFLSWTLEAGGVRDFREIELAPQVLPGFRVIGRGRGLALPQHPR
jgi:hypothetical protein